MATIKELFNDWKEKFDSITSKDILHLSGGNEELNRLLGIKKPVLQPIKVRG